MAESTTRIRDSFVFEADTHTLACLFERFIQGPPGDPNNVNVVAVAFMVIGKGCNLVRLVTGPDDPDADPAFTALQTQRTIEELNFLGIKFKMATVIQELNPGNVGSEIPGIYRLYLSALFCHVDVLASYWGETTGDITNAAPGQVSFFFEVPREQALEAAAIIASQNTDTKTPPCITRGQCKPCSGTRCNRFTPCNAKRDHKEHKGHKDQCNKCRKSKRDH